jgi:hypothetical protein
MAKQPWSFLPKTTLGSWSVGLVIAMPILMILGSSFMNLLYPSVPSGDTILMDIAARPALAFTMLAAFAAGIAAFFIGLITILQQREKSLLVYAATLIGALLLMFLAGEFLRPH